MANSTQDVSRSIGFCTVRAHAEHGFFGGYLILNTHARPLEFHCTLPVKPSRAQSILYGSTLPDFVCGEQIAKALVAKAKITPTIVLTDCPAVLALGHVSDQLTLWIQVESAESDSKSAQVPTINPARLHQFKLGANLVGVLLEQAHIESHLREMWDQLEVTMDVTEPFERIAEALLEAHPVMKSAA